MKTPCENCKAIIEHDDPEAFAECDRCQRMNNKAMARKLQNGEAVDVSGFQIVAGDYVLPDYADNIDYCDSKTEEWIWSIGRHRTTGQIRASTGGRFYNNPEWECLWLR